MQRILLLLLCLSTVGGLYGQTVLEDFETGEPTLPWNAYEGTFVVVANPIDTVNTTTPYSTSNTSEYVGSYTKSAGAAYSYFVAELAEPLDLSTNNQFSIQVYAGAATRLIMKLEQRDGGATAQSIERSVNIPTASVWRTYTFDFSDAADLDQLNNIILFFDPGTEGSEDTYLFDNLTVSPAGDCAGTVADPTVLDDFECQRNATYGLGYDDLRVVANPDPSGINTSAGVGEYTDRDGAYHALVIDTGTPLDLTTNNYLCMKVWAPVTGNLLFKLEGGTEYEEGVQIDMTDTWTEVCVDLTAQAGGGNTRIVFFFNAGTEMAAGDVYYIDDITLTPAPAPAVTALEDFEDGPRLNWTAGGVNGTFNGAIANPDKEGNDSDNVGSYTRGSANFAQLTAALPDGVDLSDAPQLNLDVWAPTAGTAVTVQLSSQSAGRVNATATVTEAESWETLTFDFSANADLNDFTSITLLFAPSSSGTGTYYFDNLTAGGSAADACAGVEADPTYLDDFECQRNVTYGVGGEFLEAVANPYRAAGSDNTSTMVGAFADQPGEFNALAIDFGTPVDLSTNSQFSIQVWAPVAGDLVFKLESDAGSSPEVRQTIPAVEEWATYTVDFSDAAGMGYTRLVIFFGAGTNNAAANTYYIDNLRLGRAPYVSDCVATFETTASTPASGTYFDNGPFDPNGLVIVENPDQSGINTSEFVALFEESADGVQPYAGLALDLSTPIALAPDAKTATMKVWMPAAATVVFKLERGDMEPAATMDIVAEYTTPEAWQELTFDLSQAVDGAQYTRITVILNSTAIPEENQTYYFDDIAVGGGDCANLTGLFTPRTAVDALRVYPNPVDRQLTIENPDGAVRFALTNMLGQQVQELRVEENRTQVQWPVDDLRAGTYLLTAQDRSGRLVARTIMIKR